MDATGRQDQALASTREAWEGTKAAPGAEPASRQSVGAAEPQRVSSAEILLPRREGRCLSVPVTTPLASCRACINFGSRPCMHKPAPSSTALNADAAGRRSLGCSATDWKPGQPALFQEEGWR